MGEEMVESPACVTGACLFDRSRHDENWADRLHRAIVASARKLVVLALSDRLKTVRRVVTLDGCGR